MRPRLAILIAIALLPGGDVCAQRSSPLARNGVDVVVLKTGRVLRGAIIDGDPKSGLLLAVRRAWAEAHSPAFFREQARREQEQLAEIYQTLDARLQAWLAEKPENKELVFFVRTQAERVKKLLAARDGEPPPPAQFMLVEIPPGLVRRVFAQPPERKQVALYAWREKLDDVETRNVADLKKELAAKGIAEEDLARAVDLSDRLPPVADDERQWAARRAIVEYQLGKRVAFQGTAARLFRADGDAKQPDLNQLIGELLKAQLEKNLAGLLAEAGGAAPADGLKKAIAVAEDEGVRGFKVTRLDQQLAAGRVTVEVRFLARMPGGGWETISVHRETLDANERRADEEQIAGDPRVGKAVEALKGLGLPVADEQLQTALRFGAATMAAQQAANLRFFRHHRRFVDRLDGPPLRWPAQQD